MAICGWKRDSSKGARCCQGLGVFTTGCGWVGTSLCGVALLVIGSVMLLFTAIVYDSSSLMGSLSDPVTTLVGAERCLLFNNEPFSDTNVPPGASGMKYGFDNNNDGVADGSLPFCTIFKGCMTAWLEGTLLSAAHAATRRSRSPPACCGLPSRDKRRAPAAWVTERGCSSALVLA